MGAEVAGRYALDGAAACERRSRGIGRRTPAARPNAIPRRQGLLIDQHYRVRPDRDGNLALRHNSRLHHLGLGRRHAGTRVLIHELDIRVLNQATGELLSTLTLDPSRTTNANNPPENSVPHPPAGSSAAAIPVDAQARFRATHQAAAQRRVAPLAAPSTDPPSPGRGTTCPHSNTRER